MPRLSEQARGIAYPQLDRDTINLIISDLLFARANRMPDQDTPRREQATAYLMGFYTRKWGLPPVLGGRI